MTLLGDAGKGWLAIILVQHYVATWSLGDETIVAVALAVLLGHIFPVFLRFEGGKGVATAVGILLGLNLAMGLLAILTWILVAMIWRISSLAALIAAALAPIYAVFFLGFGMNALAVMVMSLLLIWRHKSNISNLIAGKEARIGNGGAS